MRIPRSAALHLLKYITRFWFVVTFLGQLMFAWYILMVYYRSTALGNLEKWNSVNPHFYIKGDITGNLIFGVHVALAAIITILGPLQLIDQLRRKAPRFHRISGRIYIFSAFLISIAGLYLAWVRGTVGGLFSAITISINALIIIVCAYFTIRYAIQRKIHLHNQWAVHLLLGVSGVWLFRVFFMLWMLIHQAPVGFDPETFTGPFLYALGIFVYILPQGIVALYFRAKFSKWSYKKYAFSILLFVLTIGIAAGTAGAMMGMWLPRI
ncbi:DUF2306 domain-containing protein [Pseudobacter ginsenosidimutans]|uniref:Putative membrane protein DUF2306 n=1 Tax=Pseudobacter ginsenosidimutans TaxID=661488 RepID=A0A4Q7N4M0_9BACT|nr:DUF2306 domain-containing protein [Pseudobacter ginsenosidimutans]QEC44490.1 DUF2306 domain-containing protein [Pseudobacter ginsenosidimutans]RZS75962.1 putative membrane protein DUF2306 [Pseudobacter ginsenosidimutans]